MGKSSFPDFNPLLLRRVHDLYYFISTTKLRMLSKKLIMNVLAFQVAVTTAYS